ncbi:MAG: OmpA family protein [Pseudomonadota bacterium]
MTRMSAPQACGRKSHWSVVCGYLLLMNTPSFAAEPYQVSMTDASWEVSASPLECSLTQNITYYGRAQFYRRAGESLLYRSLTRRSVIRPGEAVLSVYPPEWRDETNSMTPPILLQRLPSVVGSQPVSIHEPIVSDVLEYLRGGQSIEVQHPGWGAEDPVNMHISVVRFLPAYRQFITCMSELYPANFEQLLHSIILFDLDKWFIRDEFRDRLKLIAGYIKLDPEIKTIIINGHADSQGTDEYNIDLSRVRSESVKEFLIDQGLPEDLMVILAFGERKPVLSNNTAANRAQNRRVYVELKREPRPVDEYKVKAVEVKPKEAPIKTTTDALFDEITPPVMINAPPALNPPPLETSPSEIPPSEK